MAKYPKSAKFYNFFFFSGDDRDAAEKEFQKEFKGNFGVELNWNRFFEEDVNKKDMQKICSVIFVHVESKHFDENFIKE